ncbi:beta-glucosidase [Phytoactinopolyspora alkaliphila]|uniref:Beta-glucosidase n=1 Tax=Phytoactinopolyspora alkaliphila TaxID=1783498 RepID=A0A6N9YLY8_9ACTN|nr:GH1 family beta-glucosidase [Phytoactinopolyspora alkaliphila]NED95947.1 beta-glucosidase [Phytoactinopolyspora alkaliphila]
MTESAGTPDVAFPPGFLWGAATSAYQIEGSLDADGRGESVWDVFARQPGAVEDGGDASVACDSYRRWPEDIELLSRMNLGAYRFSVAWSRIMPEGRGRVEKRGLDHYERFVDALLERDIVPVLTLNHWDMPQALMADGGWAGRSSVEAFAEYTAAVADRLADRVPWWITQNEPWIIALLGYRLGLHAPGIRDLGASVAAGHHVMLAHGAGADVLRAHPGVKVGAALNLLPCVPASDDERDVEAAWASDGYCNRWHLDPLFGKGYPADMREHYERALGRELTEIRAGDEAAIAGRSDFLAVNYYTRRVMRAAEPDGADQPFPWRVVSPQDQVPRTDEGTEISPDTFRDLLVRLHREYDGVPLIIAENGGIFADTPLHDGRVHDVRRQSFLRQHVTAMAEAMAAGADVRGYLHWSLMDNFEWALGYRPRFGLVHVDYRTGERTIKDSGLLYAELARTGRLPVDGDLVAGAAPSSVNP